MMRPAWRRVPEPLRVILIGVAVMGVGTQLWPIVIVAFPPVAALVVMSLALMAYWLFFTGRIGWQATAATRARWTRGGLGRREWPWAILVVIAFSVAFEASIFVTFRLVEIPAEHFLAPEGIRDLDRTLIWLLVIMSALVAGVCEEVGLRGYVQRPFVARYGAVAGIAIVAVVFAATHMGQAWAIVLMPQLLLAGVMLGAIAYMGRSLYPAILAHVTIDIFNFSYWWWSVIDRDDRPPISDTGVDEHFVVSVGVLVIGLVAFAALLPQMRSPAVRGERSVGAG